MNYFLNYIKFIFHVILYGSLFIFKKKNKLVIKVFEIVGSNSTTEFSGNTITLKFSIKNALWIKLNEHRIPIHREGVFTFKLPIKNDQRTLSIEVVGFFSRWKHTIAVENSAPKVNTPRFRKMMQKENIHFAETIPSLPSFKMNNTTKTVKIKTQNPLKKEAIEPQLKQESIQLNVDLSDLENELTKNIK